MGCILEGEMEGDGQTVNVGKGGVGRHGGSFSGRNGSFSLNLCLATIVGKL